jgi:uncharacterized sulfatase
MDERYDIIRSVRDQRFRYLRNYEPRKPYYQYMNTPEKGATMKEIRRLQASHELGDTPALFTAERKPPEELYDLVKDPHEIHNLAHDPSMRPHLLRLRQAHLDWVTRTRDLGLLPESEITLLEAEEGNRYGILRKPDSLALLTRLRDTAQQAGRPQDHVAALTQALTDPARGVRYWAATGLGNLADADGTLPTPSTTALMPRLQDASPAVRVAAARALALAQHPEAALPVLTETLASPHEWVRLQSAIALDELDERAFPAIPHLQRCLNDQPNKYITRVANRALNELLGTSHAVR